MRLTDRWIKAPPSGELASIASLRGFPSRENVVPESPQTFRNHEIKIILPLKMCRAQRSTF